MNHSRYREASRASRSKLYERYEIRTPTPSSSNGKGIIGLSKRWFGSNRDDEEEGSASSPKSSLSTLLLPAILLLAVIAALRRGDPASNDLGTTSASTTKVKAGAKRPEQGRNNYDDPDSHKRSNPFAPEGHTSVMEGALEVKRIGGGRARQDRSPTTGEKQQQQEGIQNPKVKLAWNPCKNATYELEQQQQQHDNEPKNGDRCRAKDGPTVLYECPMGCHKTTSPGSMDPSYYYYCANDNGQGWSNTQTVGDKGGACSVLRDPNMALPPNDIETMSNQSAS